MLNNSAIARFVVELLPVSMKKAPGCAHRTLVAFNAACLHDYILRSKGALANDPAMSAALVGALLAPLGARTDVGTASVKELIVSVLFLSVSHPSDLFVAGFIRSSVSTVATNYIHSRSFSGHSCDYVKLREEGGNQAVFECYRCCLRTARGGGVFLRWSRQDVNEARVSIN
jgi:U3 small nucleolar RNA-associated protein 10